MKVKKVYTLWDSPEYRAVIRFDSHSAAKAAVKTFPALRHIKRVVSEHLIRNHRRLKKTCGQLSISQIAVYPIDPETPLYPVSINMDYDGSRHRIVMVFPTKSAAQTIAARYGGSITNMPIVDHRFSQTTIDEFSCHVAHF